LGESRTALRQTRIGRDKDRAARSSERDVERVGRRNAVSKDMSFQQKGRERHPFGGERGKTQDDRVEPFSV
jgi:hypothetical protein